MSEKVELKKPLFWRGVFTAKRSNHPEFEEKECFTRTLGMAVDNARAHERDRAAGVCDNMANDCEGNPPMVNSISRQTTKVLRKAAAAIRGGK